jgi:hypothetical protein
MDNGENMKNARYATNDDTFGFINQMKNRNTSRKTEHDMKLIKNYFASIGEIRKHNMTLLHHMPYQAMVSENDQLTNIKKEALKYMTNRLLHGIFHITCHINPRPI